MFSHKIWEETELSKMIGGGVPFPMLSDETGNIGRLYDVYDNKTGKTFRATFIIDPKGYVQGSEVLNAPVGRSFHEILRQIKAFQHYEKTGEVLPFNWQEGETGIAASVHKAGYIWKEWTPQNNRG